MTATDDGGTAAWTGGPPSTQPEAARPAPNRRWIIALVVGLSFTLGSQHRRLLTCEDFKISGNDQPAGCTPGNGGSGP